jgi:hypothetical protein
VGGCTSPLKQDGRHAPQFAQEALNYALQANEAPRAVNILGINEKVDLAVKKTSAGFRVALVNHNDGEIEVELKPLAGLESQTVEWIDMLLKAESRRAESVS